MTPANYEAFKQWAAFQKTVGIDVAVTQSNFKIMFDALVANGFPENVLATKECFGAAFVSVKDQLELNQKTPRSNVLGTSGGAPGLMSHRKNQEIADAEAAKKASARSKVLIGRQAEQAFQADLKQAQSWLDCRNGKIYRGSTEEGRAVRVKAVYEKHKREMPT